MPVLSHLGRIFPPPRYMTLPSVGVDISDTSLKYVQFERGHTYPKLVHWGDINIPDGIVSRGSISNGKLLAGVLSKVKEVTGTEYVRVSLPEERAYLFETSIKHDTPYKEIRGLLEFRLEENVPLSPRDAFFDYDILESDEDDSMLRISVVVYARETILNYYKACRNANLMPLSFEVEAQAVARATVREGDEGTYMIVDFGKTRTGVGIAHKGNLMYTSTIDIGGKELSVALKNQLGEKSEDELVKLKNERGLLDTGDGAEVYGAILSTISVLKDELATRVKYWNTRDAEQGQRLIEKIILCGGSANLAGFPEYLTESLGMPVERAQVWQNAFPIEEFVPPITRRYSYGYATAIGLGLHDVLHDTP